MTVGELQKKLETLHEDMEVQILPSGETLVLNEQLALDFQYLVPVEDVLLVKDSISAQQKDIATICVLKEG